MRGADTLIPARFLTLVAHLCVVVTLLWESQQSSKLCTPSSEANYHQVIQTRLVGGLATSLALIALELVTFLTGLTMFSPSASLLSTACHGGAAITLTYYVLDGWLCGWFWPIFLAGSVLPAAGDALAAARALSGAAQLTPAGWSRRLALAAAATTLGASVPVGYNIGVINTPAEIIKTFCNASVAAHYGAALSEPQLSFLWAGVVSAFIVGGCAGSLCGALLADTWGRKRATIATSVLYLVGAALFLSCGAANSVEMLMLGRLVVGLAAGLTTSIVPVYLSELAPPRLAGTLAALCPTGVNLGVFAGQLMGFESILGGECSWPYLLSCYGVLVLAAAPALPALPESPKYLYEVRRDPHAALAELSRLRGAPRSLVAAELRALGPAPGAGGAGGAPGAEGAALAVPLCGLWRRELRLPTLLVVTAQAGQQTSGINAVFYYSQHIFVASGLSAARARLAGLACAGVNVLTALGLLRALPRAPRRPLLLASAAAAAALLFALTAAMLNIHAAPWMPALCAALVVLYVLAYGLGLGPIPYFIASELFDTRARGAGAAAGSLANWAGNLAVGLLFPWLSAAAGAWSFALFGAATAALLAFHWRCLPETRPRAPVAA